MKKRVIEQIDYWHGRVAHYLFCSPIPFPLRPSHREKVAQAQQYFLKNRNDRQLIAAGGRQLVVHVFEPEKSRAKALILHGWMSRAVYMTAYIKALLEDGVAVYAVDFPGHGEAAMGTTYWWQSLNGVLNVDQEVGPFDFVIGHSYGGAMAVAGLNSDKLIQKPPLRSRKCVLLASPSSAYTVRQEIKKFFWLNENSGRHFDHFSFEGQGHRVEDLAIEKYFYNKEIDTLFVYDKKDRVVPFREVERLQSVHPDMRLLLTENLGHLGHLYDPSTVSQVIDFLNKN